MDNKKIRIAFFGDDFSRQGKGTALVIQKIAEELVLRHPDEVEITLLRPAGACRSVICEEVRSVIIPRRYSTLLSYFWFFLTHRGTYDVIVFNRMVYPGFFFLRSKRKILLLHDASTSEVYSVPRTGVNWVFENFLKYIGQHFLDIVIGDSRDACKWISRVYGIPERKTRMLALAAGDEYREFIPEEREERTAYIKKQYAITTPYILDVSRFDPHKNIERVIEAFFVLKKDQLFLHSLVLVGGRHTPDYSDRVEEMIRTSPYRDSVIVLDYVETDDMPAIYNCADVLVYPSLVEGFGLPIVEAMRSGTPVVTSNISSMPEVAGGAAVLVDSLDAAAIVSGIKKILGDTQFRDSLVLKGLERVKVFSWARSAEALLKLCR